MFVFILGYHTTLLILQHMYPDRFNHHHLLIVNGLNLSTSSQIFSLVVPPPQSFRQLTPTPARIPILHTPTVRLEAPSVSLSGSRLLSNLLSSTRQPTAKERLHIDISQRGLNGLRLFLHESETNLMSRMFIKWAMMRSQDEVNLMFCSRTSQ